MKKSPHLPLQKYSDILVQIFQRSISQRQPAMYLYSHSARSSLFMTESLLRLLKGKLHIEKTGEYCKIIKKLEDGLGKIDEYDNYLKEFSKNPLIKKEQLFYLRKKKVKAIKKLDEKLYKNDFFQKTLNELGRLRIDLSQPGSVLKMKAQIKKELNDCFVFYSRYPKNFPDIEGQVHKLRRKLRWISMYAQSLEGIIALKTVHRKFGWENKFITKEQVLSPYNKIPVKKDLEQYIYFNKKAFLALSFVVDKLGEIKDKGLAITVLEKAISATSKAGSLKLSPERKLRGQAGKKLQVGERAGVGARNLAMKELGQPHTEKELLKEAHELLADFFLKKKIHEMLIL